MTIGFETQQALAAALGAGDQDRAGAIAKAALAAGQRHAALYLCAGVAHLRDGDAHGAITLLQQGLELQPDLPQLLMALGDALRFTGQLAEARAALEAAIARLPGYPAAWFSHALTLEAMGLLEPALASYARVAALAPETPGGHAGMAAVLAELGRTAESGAAAQRALALAPDDPTALIAIARHDIAEGRHADAARRLAPLGQRSDLLPADQVVALTLLGDALDAGGEHDAAFAAYSAAKQRLAAQHERAGPSQHLPLLRAIERAVAAADPARLAAAAPAGDGEAARHIFLIGYPRSGVTLVEQVLATAPGVETLEEHPTLAASARYLSGEGIAALCDIGEDEARAQRRAYWAAVRRFGIDPAGKTFVDMEPLKTLQLPLIARLFPEARVVFVRRDPRDVVWSCFRRSLVLNAASREFSSLEATARHYDLVMQLAETCLRRLPLSVHVVSYDRLVRDFDAETQRLCDFAGLPWSAAMRRFEATARRRAVSTRSAAQVRRGLFDGGGQWRRYERHLAPVLPVLEPWVKKFGYA